MRNSLFGISLTFTYRCITFKHWLAIGFDKLAFEVRVSIEEALTPTPATAEVAWRVDFGEICFAFLKKVLLGKEIIVFAPLGHRCL